jgi:hypothetical protein
MIWLKTLPIAGPKRARITITTTATSTRIKAYSTKPWPLLSLKVSIVDILSVDYEKIIRLSLV